MNLNERIHVLSSQVEVNNSHLFNLHKENEQIHEEFVKIVDEIHAQSMELQPGDGPFDAINRTLTKLEEVDKLMVGVPNHQRPAVTAMRKLMNREVHPGLQIGQRYRDDDGRVFVVPSLLLRSCTKVDELHEGAKWIEGGDLDLYSAVVEVDYTKAVEIVENYLPKLVAKGMKHIEVVIDSVENDYTDYPSRLLATFNADTNKWSLSDVSSPERIFGTFDNLREVLENIINVQHFVLMDVE